jgi:hypothetical protein
MNKRLAAIALALSAPYLSWAAVITSVDLVDSSDGIGMPPAGRAAVDVMVELTNNGDEWTAAGMRVDTFGGASFFYRIGTNGVPNLRNPNAGNPPENRSIWATSVSNPSDRTDADSRFSFADIAIAGGYSPATPPPPTATPATVNVSWFRTPDDGYFDGAVARIVFDLPAGITTEELVVTSGTVTPPDSHPLVLVRSIGQMTPAGHDLGTVNASVMFPAVTGIDWVLSAVPEPASVGLVALGIVVLVSRRPSAAGGKHT